MALEVSAVSALPRVNSPYVVDIGRIVMATTTDELREHLVAAIEAAPELMKEDREHLADVFLDQLHASFNLVPRAPGKGSQSARPAGQAAGGTGWIPFALLLAFLAFTLPAASHHDVPIFLVVVAAVFLAARGCGLGMKRCRSLRQEGD